jgi:hypothetical protein
LLGAGQESGGLYKPLIESMVFEVMVTLCGHFDFVCGVNENAERQAVYYVIVDRAFSCDYSFSCDFLDEWINT